MLFYARGILMKWMYHPNIVHFKNYMSIREIPLPAVTICSPLVAKADFANYGKYFNAQINNESLDSLSP